MKTNKNGVKLLAAVVAFAMAFAGAAFIIGDSDVEAASADETNIYGSLPGNGLTFDNGAIVNVVGNLTIKEGESLTIGQYGKLNIDKDVTMTVKGTLRIDDQAQVNVNGTLIVTGDKLGKIVTEDISSVGDVPDSAFIDKWKAGFNINGTMTVEKGATVDASNLNISVKNNGTFNVTSLGTMVTKISGAVDVAPGATFKLNGAVNTKLTVTASDGTVGEAGKTDVLNAVVEITGSYANTMTSSKASNLTFTATKDTVTAYSADKKIRVTTYNLDMAGSLQNGDAVKIQGDAEITGYKNGTTASAKEVSYKDKVTVGGNLSITNGAIDITETGYLLVAGSITATKTTLQGEEDPVTQFGYSGNGTVEVSGTTSMDYAAYKDPKTTMGKMIITGGKVTISNTDVPPVVNGLHGAWYVLPTDSGSNVIVSSLEDAITAATENDKIRDIYANNLDGDNHYVISKSFEIPSNLTLTVEGYITIPEDVTVTVGAESSIVIKNDEGVEVNGKLIDNTYSIANGKVISEVIIDDTENAVKTYTSLAIALEEAEDGATIILSNKAEIEGTFTIPAGKTVDMANNNIVVLNDSELIVNGVILTSDEGKIILTDAPQDKSKSAGKITINNMVVVSQIYKSDETSEVTVAGIYATGTIGDFDETTDFILAPAVAAENSATLTDLEVKAKTSYSSDLTFKAAEDDEQELKFSAEASFGKIVIDGYTVTIDVNGKLTATITAQTTSGESVVKLTGVTDAISISVIPDDSGDELVTKLTINETEVSAVDEVPGKETPAVIPVEGAITIDTGVVYIGTLSVGDWSNKTKYTMTIADGAELVVPKSATLTIVTANGADNYFGLTVNGKITVDEGTLTIDGAVLVNGEMYFAKGTPAVTGTVQINGALTVADDVTLAVNGKLILGDAPETLGTSPVISGSIKINDDKFIISYPGADLSAAEFNVVDGVSSAKKVDYFVNGSLYMTTYSVGNISFDDIIPATLKVVGYEDIKFGTATVSMWYTIPEMNDDAKKLVSGTSITDDVTAVYAKATPSTAWLKASIGTGISLWIDGVKYTSGQEFTLNVGEYNVEITINPGYKGTAKIMFNGAEVTNGKLVVTPEMSKTADTKETAVVVSATGDIAIDNGSTSGSSSNNDDGMGITDILLIVLVVLAAILVVIVALRMMRS